MFDNPISQVQQAGASLALSPALALARGFSYRRASLCTQNCALDKSVTNKTANITLINILMTKPSVFKILYSVCELRRKLASRSIMLSLQSCVFILGMKVKTRRDERRTRIVSTGRWKSPASRCFSPCTWERKYTLEYLLI